MHCPSCGFENPEGLKFCNDCGAPLRMPCAQCGFVNQPQAKFYGACGTPLTAQTPAPPAAPPLSPLRYTPGYLAEKILTAKAALEGERKQVTVLFADLKSSMELLADRDPEEARQILDPVLEHMIEAVHRYEGTVNQVMGDGIMALFGAPLAHEDHAVRACYAALRMQETVTGYGDEIQRSHGISVQIRVGLNSGEVVVRGIDSSLHMDYTAVGQTTHLAARMEQMATPGSVLVTAETLQLAKELVQVKPLGPVPVKGLTAPVEVFELLGAGSTRTRLQAFAARELTHFVGRQAELEAICQALEQADAGHGQLVAVIGEPGVGKTRLFYEFICSNRTQGCFLLEGHGVSHGKATPYLPIRDLLKVYFQLEARDDVARLREKLISKLLTLDDALRPTLPALLTLLDVAVEDREWQAIDLRFNLRNALLPLGEHRQTFEHLRAAETLATALNDQWRLGRAYAYLAEYFRLTGELDRAVESGKCALAIATALGDFPLQVVANIFLGSVYHALGDYRGAVDCFRRNVAYLTGDLSRERFGMAGLPAVMSRTWLVSCLADLGAFDEGAAQGGEAVRLAEAVDHPFSLTQAYSRLGSLYLCKGDLHQAIPVLERSLELCQNANILTWFPTVAAPLGYAYTLVGRVAEALPLLQQAAAQDTSGGISAGYARWVAYLSEAYLLTGRMNEATGLARSALAFARDLKARGNEAYPLWLLGEIYSHQDSFDAEQAEAYYRQALTLAEELGMRPLRAHCHLGLGTLYAKIDQREQARAELSTAIDLYRAMDMTFWLPPAERTLAQVEDHDGY
jgi:class 3 adenylate cyclase/tetratricopeptide (TPR) repeat protein